MPTSLFGSWTRQPPLPRSGALRREKRGGSTKCARFTVSVSSIRFTFRRKTEPLWARSSKVGRCTLHGLHVRSSCLHPCEATCSLCMVQPAVRSPNPRAAPRLELVGFTRRASPAPAAAWPAAGRQQPCRTGCKSAPGADKGSIPAYMGDSFLVTEERNVCELD